MYIAISASFVTNRHILMNVYLLTYLLILLARAVRTTRQIELDGNSIRFALLNRFESIRLPKSIRVDSSQLYTAQTVMPTSPKVCNNVDLL